MSMLGLVFDHQMDAVNLLTRLNWESRAHGTWRALADELADYLLFVGEVPPPAKVTPRDSGAQYAHLSAADRVAILEILRDTKKDLPEVFRASSSRGLFLRTR